MKRLISMVLSLVMVISLLAYLPIQAYAVDITNYVLTYPVTKSHKYLTRGYMSGHLALDINPRPDSASKSTNVEVMAACDGKVIAVFTGCKNWNGYGKPCNKQGLCSPSNGYTGSTVVSGTQVKKCMCNYSFGNGVIIYNSSTKTYLSYAHMKDSITVKVGDKVVAGQLIGYMGSYANSSGMHLHFDILSSKATSPSMSDYWSNYNSGNFVNANPYGDITVLSTAKRYGDNIHYNFLDAPSVGASSKVTIELYSTQTAGKTGDTWLYPAFAAYVPNYRNSGITTVGYSVTNELGKEMFRFEETYRSGVLKDGSSYKRTTFGARTDGKANIDLEKDIYNVKSEYLTNEKFVPGHSYRVTAFVIFDGKRYESPKFTMSTTGSKKCSWDSGKETKSPTCTGDGSKTYTCLSCGATKTETIPPKGHTPGAAANCLSGQTCTVCGVELAPKTDHNWNSGIVTSEPTCLSEGIKTYTCSSCGETKTETIVSSPHIPGAAATCTTPQKCVVCETQLKPALGHNYSGSYYYSAHPHEEYQKCSRCNAEKKTGNTKKVDDCSICHPAVTYTLTYNPNGGTAAPDPQTKTSGTAITISTVKPTRQGYTFLGWATTSTAAAAEYTPGASFTTDADTTLYAVWKPNAPAAARFTSVNTTKGERVVLEFVVEKEIKANALLLGNFEYDKSALTLDYDNIEICPSTFMQQIDRNEGILIAFNSTTAVSGTVFKIPFIVSSTANDGEYAVSGKLEYQASGVEGSFDVVTESGSITVTSVKPGDVDGDGKVNSDDAIYLMWNTFRPERYPVSNRSHDYNKDGMVTADDAIYLMWYTFRPERYPIA